MAEKEEQNERPMTYKFLPLTLRLETLGGIATPLILRGTPLPAQRSQLFSTAVDNQSSVEIQVLIGESPIAKNNVKIQTLNLTGIPKAARGEPQILVTFEVDQACNVTASATEKGSGLKVTVKFDDAQLHLNDNKIKRLLDKAEATRAEDEKLLKYIEANNKAASLIAKAETRLRENQEKGLTTEEDKTIEKVLASLGLALETKDDENIRSKVTELERLVSSPAFGDLQNLFGVGDIFSTFFSAPQKKSPQRTPTKEPIAKRQKSQDQLTTSRRTTGQIGKIFGGSEFTIDPNLCFVLIPFEQKMYPIYEDHIRSVVESEGLSCLRADEIVSTNQITWDIWEKINRARLIIADLTGKNANVFYEVGLANALGKEVILITQTMKDVPFDLKLLRCIVYSFTPRGMKDMETKLKATIKEIMKSS